MDADWITSPSARRVQQHATDSRPAWLWSQDGQLLIWQNDSAPLFLAKIKKHGLKLAPPALPIKGQIARNIRLGSPGRTSLARIQFLAGDKPTSSTCATTPLIWQDGQTVLLVVAVDPIAEDVLKAALVSDASEAGIDAASTDESQILADVASQPIDVAPESDPASEPPAENLSQTGPLDEVAEAQAALDEPEQMPEDDGVGRLIVADEASYAQELENWRQTENDSVREARANSESLPDDAPDQGPSRLSLLVDRLAADEALFTPLTEADDAPPALSEPEAATDDFDPEAPTLFKVTGRGFLTDHTTDHEFIAVADAEADVADLARLDGTDEISTPAVVENAEDHGDAQIDEPTSEIVPDVDSVERVSRYNFDELARILTDRVGEPVSSAPVVANPTSGGSLVNLGGETLVLNRLPLGILVFRDQQVLFANRAITEMVGYESVERLRAAGLAAVFPAAGPDGAEGAGPVNHLVQRDGTLVPVTARLQSISWQGKPALMLSASTTEVRTGHEAAVAAFARTVADVRNDGFFEATRAGVISGVTPRCAALLNIDGILEGKPLTALVSVTDVAALREFLERPAKFAETERPLLIARSLTGSADILLFAQGQAGIVTGYFGFVRQRDTAPVRISNASDADPALLTRISRGVRRPLNTIIGFADLLRSEAFGPLQNERYEAYAQDITTAGQEIAALVDELDDYARLRDGRYLPQRASIELTGLLESCVLRIRQQASSARVIIRNAIAENLPRVTADRASLAQAVLNLLASAIDQTPTGGGVVISAQREDDGGISVHVRDSSTNAVEMAERFVVFRDGVNRDGQAMVPVRSSIGLALTRSLLAVNTFSLSVDPAGEQGMLFTMKIPVDLVEASREPEAGE